MNNKTEVAVFVYGTLKKGKSNNGLMKGGTLLSGGTIGGLTAYYSGGKGSFPVAIPEEGSYLRGEVWKIPKNKLPRLDELEGYRGKDNDLYKRSQIQMNGYDVYVYTGGKQFQEAIKEGRLQKLEPLHKGKYYEWE